MKYRVIFSGTVAAGRSEEEVRKRVGEAFRLDAATVAGLLSGREVVIKKGVDRETADRFQQIMAECGGGVCRIEAMAPSSLSAAGGVAADEEGGRAKTAGTGTAAPPPSPPRQTRDGSMDPSDPPDYDFSIAGMLREAWQLTSGVKGTLFGALGMVMLISIGLNLCLRVLLAIVGAGVAKIALVLAGQLTITLALYPFIAGVTMIGIHRACGLPVRYTMVFGYFEYTVPILIASFLTTLFTYLGLLLLLLPGIYLGMAYVLTIPLIIARDMEAWQAMEASRRAVSRHWFKVFGLYAVMGAIVMVSALPLGLGMIWTMPMFVVLNGILFRTIFGKGVGSASAAE